MKLHSVEYSEQEVAREARINTEDALCQILHRLFDLFVAFLILQVLIKSCHELCFLNVLFSILLFCLLSLYDLIEA